MIGNSNFSAKVVSEWSYSLYLSFIDMIADIWFITITLPPTFFANLKNMRFGMVNGNPPSIKKYTSTLKNLTPLKV